MTQEINNDNDKPRMYDSIFWIEVEKIKPNPYQPRREFEKEDGGLGVEYELISGERRLRASTLAGVKQVPTVIRTGQDDNRVKLELAIIENLQREDLNPIDRARAFGQLADEFKLKHVEIGKKVGRSREYVSNTIRLLSLPQEVLEAIATGKISEGHSRPILMLADRPEEQIVLFKEVLYKKLTVRETESIARRIAYDRVRKKEHLQDPEIAEFEERFTERLGTRVRIEKKSNGGKMVIDFFSNDDLRGILELMKNAQVKSATALMDQFLENQKKGLVPPEVTVTVEQAVADLERGKIEPDHATISVETPEGDMATEIQKEPEAPQETPVENPDTREEAIMMNDQPPEEAREQENIDDADLYSVSGFSI